MQKRAYELNSHLFVPPEGIQYHRMARVTDSQALRALKHLKSFDNQNDYILELNSVCDRLAFGVEAELFEQALEDVAKIIGIASSRPEKNIGKGPDCLWLNDSEKFLIIEAKSQVDLGRREIYKSESEQLIHSCEWFKQEYERKSGRPVMFHPAISLAREAVFPVEGRVVTPDALRKFVSGVRAFGTGVIANGLQGITERQIREQLELNRLQFDQCFGGGTKVE